ncbi:DUF4931 domain-containing protein [Candidatus Uhrbacteria bacterium]|nr:DUF4931 domain-containing protein [Candidatus Uhrbacteria bacterium]
MGKMKNQMVCDSDALHAANRSCLTRDPLTGDLVIFAPGRRKRPQPGSKKADADPLSAENLNDDKILAVYAKDGFRITAVENLYPVFHKDRELKGRQEILVEGDRCQRFEDFSATQMAAVLDAMADRAKVLRSDPGLKYLVMFKNEGREAGASLVHAHSQVFGLSFVPDRLKQMRTNRRKITDLHSAMLGEATKERAVFKDKNIVAFADPYSRFAYGVRLVTRRRHDNITQTSPAERRSLAKALAMLMPLIKKRGFAYNFYFHDVFSDKNEFFEIRFAPRANTWAGFELDAGIVVNPVTAEDAAAEYLDAIRGKK